MQNYAIPKEVDKENPRIEIEVQEAQHEIRSGKDDKGPWSQRKEE